MGDEPPEYFRSVETLEAIGDDLAFEPRMPGRPPPGPAAFRLHVLDHRRRQLPVERRTLEVHWPGVVFSQALRPGGEARRLVEETEYGQDARPGRIAGRTARIWPPGPEVAPDDPDGPMPGVVTWFDGDLHFLVASRAHPVERLIDLAESVHD